MKQEIELSSKLQFLSNGGEMGKLIRAADWEKTPLGNPESWPQSLRTMVSVMLNNPFGMYIAWGKEYTQIYNDGYRPILGATKHPQALGLSTRETFAEIWNIIESMFDGVMNGVPVGFPDLMLPLNRNGFIENCYFDFAYSPIKNDDGEVGGVLVTVIETTSKKKALDDLKESEERLHRKKSELEDALSEIKLFKFMADNAGDPFILMREDGSFAYLNKIAIKKWGYTKEELEHIKVPDVDPIYNAGKFKELFYRSLKSDLPPFETLHKNKQGHIYPVEISLGSVQKDDEPLVFAIARDITARKKAESDIINASRKIEESEKRFRNSVRQAPLGIAIFTGKEFIVTQANDTYLVIVDRTEDQFIGHSLFESIPEVKEIVEPIFKEVFRTGIPFYGNEFVVPLKRMGKLEHAYFNFVYHPLKDADDEISQIMVVAMEVTNTVVAKHLLEESEKHFRNMVMQSPIPMTIIRGKEYIIESANKVMFENVWRKSQVDVIGKPILEVFPELNEQKYPELLKKVFTSGETYSEKESVAYVDGNDGMKKFYLDFEYAALFEPDGSITRIMITVNDVTDKVEARKKVESAEERLRLATEATGISTWEMDLTTNHFIHSPRLAVIFGHQPSKVITYAQLRSQIHPEDVHDIVEKAFEQGMKTHMYIYEARVVKPDNTICWIRKRGKVFFDEDNNPVKIIGTLQDITDEKHLQQVLQESESKFRLLADSLPQHIWTADTVGKPFYFNQNVFDFSGLTHDQLEKDGWIQMIHPDDREENIRFWMESVSSGKDFLFEHRFRRFDGEYRWQLTRIVPQKDASGNIQMWVGSSTDIQEIKEQEHEKDYFISMASHELKTPLTTIKGYVQMLQIKHEKSPDTFLQNSLKTIDKQTNTLTKLIAELLDVSKIKSGGLNFNKEYFEITGLVNEIVSEVKQINPDFQIPVIAEEKVMVFADRDRIGQVLINFLTNAVKYSPNSKTVQIACSVKDNKLIVAVKDFGIGIRKKDQTRVFERFYRVEGTNESTFPGFGIGLFIASEIIRRHDGKIKVKSEYGKGSVFSFELPLTFAE
ncbi:MAG: PAS domain S-box protein [Ginsengibacter sp.]